MRDLNRRLDGLEATLAFKGKPFIIWTMIDGRRMSEAEIEAAFQEGIANGRASPGDRPLKVGWTTALVTTLDSSSSILLTKFRGGR